MSKYIDGTRVVYFDDLSGNLTVPGLLSTGGFVVPNDDLGTIANNFVHYDTVTKRIVYNQTGGGGGGSILFSSLNLSTLTTTTNVVAGSHVLGEETTQIVDYDFSNFGQTWTQVTSAGIRPAYPRIVLSATGKHQLVSLNPFGGLLVSNNYGASFTLVVPGSIFLYPCVSATGQHMYAGVYDNNNLFYASHDFGVTWTSISIPSMFYCVSATCSADGQLVLLGQGNAIPFSLRLSRDFGATFSTVTSLPSDTWISAMSATGQYIVATPLNSTGGAAQGRLYVSRNFGADWTSVTASPLLTNRQWQFCTVSSDGSTMLASALTSLYVSRNYGITWSAVTGVNADFFPVLSLSYTGQYQLVTGNATFGLYYSSNYGQTFTARTFGSGNLAGGLSANAQYMLAGDGTGYLYTSSAPTLFPAGFLAPTMGTSSITTSTLTAAASLFAPIVQTSSITTSTLTAAASLFAPQLQTSSITASTLTAATSVVVPTFQARTVATSSIATSSITTSTLTAAAFLFAPQLQTSSITASTLTTAVSLFVPQLQTSSIATSTLTAAASLFTPAIGTSSITASTLTAAVSLFTPAIGTSSIVASTLTTAVIGTSSITASTLTAAASLVAPVLQTSSITASTFTAAASLFVPQLQTSSLVASTLTAAGSLIVPAIGTSSILVSTLTAATSVVVPTFQARTVAASSIATSSITTSTLTAAAFLFAPQLQTSSIVASTLTATSLTANAILGISSIVAPNSFYAQELYIDTRLDSAQFARTWVSRTAALTFLGSSATSASGQFRAAYTRPGSGSVLYISRDYGTTWSTTTLSYLVNSVAMSASGQYIVLTSSTTIGGAGFIYVSNNYGVSFSQTATAQSWGLISVSASGQYMTAIVSSAPIYRSSDYGLTFAAVAGSPSLVWTSVAVSASGQIQTATISSGGAPYRSTDYGVTFAQISGGPTTGYQDLGMSASGQYQTITASAGKFWISSNFGVTFNEIAASLPSPQIWNSVAISASGQYQVISAFQQTTGPLYASVDYGSTWSPVTTGLPSANWRTVSLSASGQYMTLANYDASTGGNIWTCENPMVVGGGVVTPAVQTSTILAGTAAVSSFAATVNNDGIQTASVSQFDVAGGNFTMECFFYPTSTPASWGTILSLGVGAGAGREFRLTQRVATGGFGMLIPLSPGVSHQVADMINPLPLNAWYHIAMVRSGNTVSLYSNGTSVSTMTTTYGISENHIMYLYRNPYADPTGQGYLNSVRVVTGQALYTGTFTPSFAPLTATSVGTSGANVATSITGTVAILTAQTSGFVDLGPSRLALTTSGSPTAISSTSPFPAAATFNGTTSLNGTTNLSGTVNLNGTLATNLNFPSLRSNTPNLGVNYKAIAMAGGNSVGYLYGAYESLGDGVHLSYNYINCNLGGGSSTCNLIPNAGGNTTQLSMNYDGIRLQVGAINAPPSTVMTVIRGGVGINTVPTQALDVKGDLQMTGTLTFNDEGQNFYYIKNARTTVNAEQASTFQILGYNDVSKFVRSMVTITPLGLVGINCNVPTQTLDVGGDAHKLGNGTTWNVTSDRRIKTDILNADLAICASSIKALPLRYYQYDSNLFPDRKDKHVIGCVAQEVLPVFPKAVSFSSNYGISDLMGLDYDQIYMANIGATKHLGSVVETQSTQIAALLAQVSTMNDAISYIPQLVSTLSGLGH